MRSTRYGAVGLVLASLTLPLPVMGAGGETVDRSTPTSTLELSYDLYVGGIALGKVAMSARFQGTDYKAISTLETSGIVNAFWQSKIEAASNGLVQEGDVRPALYDSYSQNRKDERRQVTLTFGPEGPKSLFSDPPYPESPVQGERGPAAQDAGPAERGGLPHQQRQRRQRQALRDHSPRVRRPPPL